MGNWTLQPIDLVDAFGLGVYMLMVLTHFDLWWHRRDRPAHLWLATAAAGAVSVNLTGLMHRHIGIDMPLPARLLNMLGVAVALIGIFELVQTVARRRVGRTARAAQALALLLVATAAWHPQPTPFIALMVLSVGFLLLATFDVTRLVLSGDLESRVLAAGLFVLLGCLIVDLLGTLRVAPRIEGLPVLGFSVLFLSAARMLSLRLDREYRELVALRAQLEQRVAERTQALADANRRLDQLARTDSLTGLRNRRSFLEETQGHDGVLMLLDIDHFKRINDSHGHDVGDAALREVAATLRGALPDDAVIARWGGEEFIALLPQAALDHGLHQAEQVRAAIAAIRLHAGTAAVPVAVSIGVAAGTGEITLDERVHAADQALYRAKQQGRNRVVAA